MRIGIIIFFTLFALGASAKAVEDFNKVLFEEVKRSIQTDNDQALKSKDVVLRGPASVDVKSPRTLEKNNKIEKNVNQFGPQKW